MTDYISRADVFEIIDKAFSQPMRNGVALYADICLMLNALPTHANSRSTHERDYISRADAIDAVRGLSVLVDDKDYSYFEDALKALPSADAVEVDRTSEWVAVRREEYEDYLAKSAEADGEDLIIKGAKGIQDGLYNIKDGKLFKYKANGGTVRTYPIVPSSDAVKRVDCSNFLLWLLEEIMDEDNWEFNAVADGEIIARKLKKLGLLEVKDGYYHRIFDENVWVVRCKDCEYADFNSPYPVCNFLEMNICENGYCSWARMKGGGEQCG